MYLTSDRNRYTIRANDPRVSFGIDALTERMRTVGVRSMVVAEEWDADGDSSFIIECNDGTHATVVTDNKVVIDALEAAHREGMEAGSSSLTFLACSLLALVPVSLVVVFVARVAGAVAGVMA